VIAALGLAVDDSKVRPGWIAFFIVLGLGVATVLLWRSMNHQLSKISVKRAAEQEAAADSDEPVTDEEPEADDDSPSP
jgi:hypothetical protein